MIGEPRVVEAGRGAVWWAEGWHIFTAKVGTWIGIMVIYVVISALISAVPFVGSPAITGPCWVSTTSILTSAPSRTLMASGRCVVGSISPLKR